MPLIMQKLRSIHLYLGCLFAPLLLFFAVSGLWQALEMHSSVTHRLSTIHTLVRLKDNSELGSLPLRLFVVVMALSFIGTTTLGVVMALKFGRSRRAAIFCLAAGVLIPVVLILMRLA